MITVIDTNVFVSALLTPFRSPARILDLLLFGELTVGYDDRIMAEYRSVLAWPKFGFAAGSVAELLVYVETTGIPVSARPLPVELPDPDDAMFLEVAAALQSILITGNLRHFPPEQCHGVSVMAPADFLRAWQQQSR